jgi:hypothetical protein
MEATESSVTLPRSLQSLERKDARAVDDVLLAISIDEDQSETSEVDSTTTLTSGAIPIRLVSAVLLTSAELHQNAWPVADVTWSSTGSKQPPVMFRSGDTTDVLLACDDVGIAASEQEVSSSCPSSYPGVSVKGADNGMANQ